MPTPHLTHISDTARWVAVIRAREARQRRPLFHDHLALKLAGMEGNSLEELMRVRGGMPDWPITMRTVAIDDYVRREVRDGVDMVIDLAAGLDARPYRLPLPKELVWVDVDFEGITAHKNEILKDVAPNCRVERIVCDLADTAARRALFAGLGARAKKALIITEGLLVYLTEAQVVALAEDLRAVPTFALWVAEICSAKLLRMLQRQQVGKNLAEAGMPMQWGTAQGPEFFLPHGWTHRESQSTFRLAYKHRRLPWFYRPFAWLPEPKPPWKEVWAGISLLDRT